jgi:hypothetical protein
VAVDVVCPPGDHEYVNGGVPPEITLTVAVPSIAPDKVSAVIDVEPTISSG